MKAFVAALLFGAVAAVALWIVLDAIQQPSSVAFATSSTRVGNPGNNLIGPNG
jgi:hypothetical protein